MLSNPPLFFPNIKIEASDPIGLKPKPGKPVKLNIENCLLNI